MSDGIKEFLLHTDWHIVLVGDKKSKFIESSERLTFLSVLEQKKLGYQFVEHCPYNHYARKNIGYLYAIQQGADVIFDTDDDNRPYSHWSLPDFIGYDQVETKTRFINAYSFFTKELIWPRGFPLDEIQADSVRSIKKTKKSEVGVWQGLADKEPDVDAIFRLIFDKYISFEHHPPFILPKNVYCPFNSQNTFWAHIAFPYLYLPSEVGFRFTDILRGYIAQRLFWTDNLHLGFTKATVYQERNQHNLLSDFSDELDCYMNIKPIVNMLDSLILDDEPTRNLELVYNELTRQGFVPAEEKKRLLAWMSDYTECKNG